MPALIRGITMSNGNGTGKDRVTSSEAARRLGVDARTIRRMVARGQLEAITINDRGDLRILITSIDQFEQQQQTKSKTN